MKLFNVYLIIVSLICLIGLVGCTDSDDPVAGDTGSTGSTGTTGSTGDTGSANENPVNGLYLTPANKFTDHLFVFSADEFVNIELVNGKPMRGTFVQDGEDVTITLGSAGFIVNCSYDGTTFTILGFDDNVSENYLSSYLKFEHNGTQRHYLFHKPENIEENAPLIFMLHGWGGYARDAQRWHGLDAVADANGFAVCYPQGRKDQSGEPHWNVAPGVWFSPSDDVGFLSSLAGYLQSEHDLDPEKTFVAGYSNGGFMTYTLAMDAPDVFKGMASFAAGMDDVSWANREDRPAKFPLLNVMGLNDDFIAGGYGGPPVDEIIDYWVGKNSCGSSDTEIVTENTTAYKYFDCDNNNEIWYYKIAKFGHDVPTVSSSAGISGAQLVWDFFQKF